MFHIAKTGLLRCCLYITFPISMAMRSSLLNDIILNWEKVQCTLNGASTGFTFFQEVPASATDDALTPAQQALFALRFRICLEQLKQLYIAHVLNHLLGLFTKWVYKHCFVVDLVEELVDEGGSQSASRVHEHDSSQLVLQQNVAIRFFWSRCQPRLTLNALIVSKQRVLRSIVVRFFFQIEVHAVTRETCLRRSLWANNGSPRSIVIWVIF